MIDFTLIQKKEKSWPELVEGLSTTDLRDLTNEMIDTQLALIAGCSDADVVFQPDDPEAEDSYAESSEEVNMPWTLGHVIVHTTATAEESAFLASELARRVAVEPHRSRHEVAWETVTTIAQCRQRLAESRRMRLATLDVWPDQPDLDNFYLLSFMKDVEVTAVIRFVLGLAHDTSHLGQIEEIVRQAYDARRENSPI